MKYLIIVTLIFINIFFSAWYIIHGDVLFHTDIARDFLLIQELDEKKLVLIGPRSSLPGMFHGPLWTYLSYPVWKIGNGNPLFQGYFWFFLNLLFLSVVYLVVNKLFNHKVALISTLLISFPMVDFTKGMFHVHGALILTPIFCYFFIRYLEKNHWFYLFLTLLFVGLISQFQIAFGFPMLIVASGVIFRRILKTKKYSHFLCFLLLFFLFANWFIFDLRHQFIQTKSIINYLMERKDSNYPLSQMFNERLNKILFSGLYLAHGTYEWLNIIMSYYLAIVLYLTAVKSQKTRFNKISLTLFFIYSSYWILSLIHPGVLLYHHYLPLISLPIIVFSSTILEADRRIFTILVSLLLLVNFIWVKDNLILSKEFFNKNQTSWKGQYEVANKVFMDAGGDFGYFIYTPDVVGYSPKYAMIYGQKVNHKIKAFPSQKKAVTYLIIAPPPPDRPNLKEFFWKSDQIKINKNPVKKFSFPNGYKVEKYYLSAKEINLLPQKYLNTGLELR